MKQCPLGSRLYLIRLQVSDETHLRSKLCLMKPKSSIRMLKASFRITVFFFSGRPDIVILNTKCTGMGAQVGVLRCQFCLNSKLGR